MSSSAAAAVFSAGRDDRRQGVDDDAAHRGGNAALEEEYPAAEAKGVVDGFVAPEQALRRLPVEGEVSQQRQQARQPAHR